MKKSTNKKVLVFGTYDLLHLGHEHHLKKAAKYGKVYVVVARDNTVSKVKKIKTVHPEKNRLENVKNLDYVSCAFLGSKSDIYSCFDKVNPNVICLGYDQIHFIDNIKEELKKRNLQTKIIKFRKGYKPAIYKSSKLRILQ